MTKELGKSLILLFFLAVATLISFPASFGLDYAAWASSVLDETWVKLHE